MVKLEALAELATEATPGPWDSACPPREWSIWSIPRSDDDPGARIVPGLIEADAAYIAAASPDVVLALVRVALAAKAYFMALARYLDPEDLDYTTDGLENAEAALRAALAVLDR